MRISTIIAGLVTALVATGSVFAQTPTQPTATGEKGSADKQAVPTGAPAQPAPTSAEPPAPVNTPTGTPTTAPVPGDPPTGPTQPAAGDAKTTAGDAKATAQAKLAMQRQCEDAIIADAEWQAQLKGQLARRLLTEEPKTKPDKVLRAQLKDMLRPEIHTKDANRMLRNKRHVVYAYAALWILTAIFVLFMWLRQRKLSEEIERLRRDVQAEMQ